MSKQVCKRPTIAIPITRDSTGKEVRHMFEEHCKGTSFEVVGGPIIRGKHVGKGFFAWFVMYEPGADDEFSDNLLEIFNAIENGSGHTVILPNGSFWHLAKSNYAHHNKTTELLNPEIQFGSFEPEIVA